MNKTEHEIIDNVCRRLEGEGASPEAQAKLAELSHYLDSWVIGPLRTMNREPRTRSDLRLAHELSRGPWGG